MANSNLLSNPNSLDTYPSFKNISSTETNQDPFTIDERDVVEQTINNKSEESKQSVDKQQVKKVKSSNPPVQCDICSVSISSQIVYDVHIQGRKHQTQLKATLLKNPDYKTPTYDELCLKKQSNEIVNNPIEKSVDSTVNKSIQLTCDICHVICNSQQMFDTHIAGKRHQMKLREGVFPVVDQSQHNRKSAFTCSVCSYSCKSNKQLQQHRIHKHSSKQQSYANNVSNDYNPFFAADNSTMYPPQMNVWPQSPYPTQYETMNPDDQMNNSKRRRIYYNPNYVTSQDYPSWDNNNYYNQSNWQYQSNPNSNPSTYYPSSQTQPLPNYLPISSHYSY